MVTTTASKKKEQSPLPNYVGSSPPPLNRSLAQTPIAKSPIRTGVRSKPLGSAASVSAPSSTTTTTSSTSSTISLPNEEVEIKETEPSVVKPIPTTESIKVQAKKPQQPKKALASTNNSVTPSIPAPALLASSSSTGVGRIRGLTNDKTVDKQLADLGYRIDDVVLVDSNGTVEARYAIAFDCVGNSVMIDLDTDGAVTVKKNCITLIESSRPGNVSHSIKAGSIRSVDLVCSGVAFKCNREICILRDEQAYETTLISPNTSVEQSSVSKRDKEYKCVPMAIPLIKMSELIAHPKRVFENVCLASRRLRNSSMGKFTIELGRFEESTATLAKRSSLVQKMFILQFDQIAQKMQQLEKCKVGCVGSTPSLTTTKSVTVPQINKTAIEYNMCKRQSMLRGLLEMSGTLNSLNNDVAKLLSSVDDLIKHLNELYLENKQLIEA